MFQMMFIYLEVYYHPTISLIYELQVRFIHSVPPIVVQITNNPITEKYDLSSLEGGLCGSSNLLVSTEEAFKSKIKNNSFTFYQGKSLLYKD